MLLDQGAFFDETFRSPRALIVRPIGLVVSLATTGLYLATVPLTFLIDVDEEAGEVLVYKPWWFTSGRDVGRFDHRRP